MSLKIVLISHSDLTGGAAVVTTRLMDALIAEGVESSMLVSEKRSATPQIHLIGSPIGRKARFISERLDIFVHNGFSRRDLFRVSIATRGYDLSRHPLVKEADAIIISWINQGTLSLKDIARLAATGKPVAWMMHDMWPMTGICHHALLCRRYEDSCGNCQFIHLKGDHSHDLSRRAYERKLELYNSAPGLRFVAVSNWLGDVACRSSMLGGRPVSVIHNPFPVDDFYTIPRGITLPDGVDITRRLIIMGAARLDDPIKGFPRAVEILNTLADRRPDLAKETQAVFYGDIRDSGLLDMLKLSHVATGIITSPDELRELYSRGTVVISTSSFETLPGTLIEGMAGGCTPVTFDAGGQRDIIEDTVDGYLVKPCDNVTFADRIATALERPFCREAQHTAVAKRFSSTSIARQYLNLLGL